MAFEPRPTSAVGRRTLSDPKRSHSVVLSWLEFRLAELLKTGGTSAA